jgi:SOS-response transcriptional repressor LexA
MRATNNDRISHRQQQFLDFIGNYSDMHGRPPTFREIAIAMDVTSKGTVSAMVDQLTAMGCLMRGEGSARTVRVR